MKARPRVATVPPEKRFLLVAAVTVVAVIVTAVIVTGCSSRSRPHVDSGDAGPVERPAGDRVLILVSLDGFRHDYVDWPEAENVRALARRGVRAEGLIPPFPSKTFPSHYTIVTGLTPGHHGIISNNMRDPALGDFHLDDRDAVENPRWWGGEPIWVTAGKAGRRTAAMFWPGTETAIAGRYPDHWQRWDGTFPYAARVARVLGWLDLPSASRPHLVTLYFQDPNDTSHAYGPEAVETREAIRRVDRHLGDLIEGIRARGLEDRVDLIVVSDHGMASVSPERVIILDRALDFEAGELFEFGAFVQIFPNPGRESLILESLRDAHPRLAVYRRDEIPVHYGLGGSDRVAPIIGIPAVGWEAMPAAGARFTLRGDHGQDPRDPRMHGIFVAAGPSFVRGAKTGRVESIELYNVMAAILGLDPAPNDGDPAALAHLLVAPDDGATQGPER